MKCDFLMLTQYLKHALKTYVEKVREKNGYFTLLNKSVSNWNVTSYLKGKLSW